MPKRLDFGNENKGEETALPPVSAEGHPKKFSFGEPTAAPPAEPVVARKPKGFNFPTTSTPEVVPQAPERHPKTLQPVGIGEAVHQRKDRPRTLTDDLIDKALAQCPTLSKADMRGKIDTLLHHTPVEKLVDWGGLNLVPLQQASNIQATMAAELNRINATEALIEAKDASTRGPSLMDRISGKKPEFYEYRLKQAKTDLTALMIKAEAQRKSYTPEVTDLQHDATALLVTLGEFADAMMQSIGSSRTKTLIAAHQTGLMLIASLTNTVTQCATFIEQIDSFLTVTLPNWKMAVSK